MSLAKSVGLNQIFTGKRRSVVQEFTNSVFVTKVLITVGIILWNTITKKQSTLAKNAGIVKSGVGRTDSHDKIVFKHMKNTITAPLVGKIVLDLIEPKLRDGAILFRDLYATVCRNRNHCLHVSNLRP